MPRYDRYGNLDDRIDQDGDVGFVGFNNRLRPDQLQAGMLADAQNIRMDRNGQAQVRRGVDLVNAPLSVGLSALTLPFTLIGADINAGSFVASKEYTIKTVGNTDFTAIGAASNTVGVVFTATGAGSGTGVATVAEIIVTATPDSGTLDITSTNAFTNFPSSGTINLSDASGISPDPNGDRAFTKVSASEIQVSDQSYSGSADTSVTLKFGILNDGVVNNIYGSTDFSDPNNQSSQYIIIASNSKAIGIDIEDSTTASPINFDIGYPAATTYSASVDMIQAFNKVFVFKGGSTALENKLKISRISAAAVVASTNLVTITTSTNHNLVTGDIVTINALGFIASNPDPNGSTKTITKTSDTQFTYALTTSSDETYTVSSSSIVATDFTNVASGTYAQPESIFSAVKDFSIINSVGSLHTSQALTVGNKLTMTDDGPTASCGLKIASDFFVNEVFSSGAGKTVSNVTISGTRITIACTDHGLKLNQPITFSDLNAGLNGNNSVAKVIDSNTFEVEVASTFSDDNDSGTVTPAAGITFIIDAEKITSEKTQAQARASDPVFIKKVSVGLGFTHMPAPPFATYHQRRLVMPFQFSVDASSDSFTTRNIQDEIIASDILDTDTYDQVYAQYRFNAGTSDFVVGLHSFAEDRLLVFNRNSIHIVSNTTNLQSASTQVLTDEVGCVARKSIEQVGNQVIFLSDNGVYGTQFLDEYNLRGTETPLSEPINETIGRINKNAQENAVSVYFDNRYYIAVPLNSVNPEGQEVVANNNNAILIYNFLNKQWESIDTVNESNYHVSNLLVLGDGDKRGVYAINDIGGVHRLDHRVDGVDLVSTQIGGAEQSIQIAGALTTRQYTFGTLDRKRWKEFDVHIQSSDTNTSDLNIDFETENPDDTGSIGTLSTFNDGVLDIGEDVSIRGRIGNRRGYGIQFTFNNTAGRPIIRAIEVQGATTMRSTNKAI